MATAEVLPVQMFVMWRDAIVGYCLGKRPLAFGRLFECARNDPCVLCFDEFDAIGKEPVDGTEMGEMV